MFNQNFDLFNQDGVSIGHNFMSFQEKKIFAALDLHIANCEH